MNKKKEKKEQFHKPVINKQCLTWDLSMLKNIYAGLLLQDTAKKYIAELTCGWK